MSKGTILKSAYLLVTIPKTIIGSILLAFDIFQLRGKLEKCVKIVDVKRSEIPDIYTSYLVAAEDHRSEFHCGIDQVGILRALYKKIFSSEIQGASTIEQQFVRVVIDDYSYSLQRKIKEQLLAVLLAKKRSKADIAKAYLAIAYYGHNCEGVEGITNLVGNDLMVVPENQIISIMARLKYPKPSVNVKKWEKRLNQRVTYIKNRHQQSANKSRRRVLRTVA